MKKLLSSLLFMSTLSSTILVAWCPRDCDDKPPCPAQGASCQALPINRPVTITQPGRYCLKRDITGQIIIASDDVEIDLNSHKITGPSGKAAIIADERTNVSIHSGSVTSQDGSDGIALTNCKDISLADIALFGTSQALVLDTCTNAKLSCLSIFDNINNGTEEATAVVAVLTSDCIDFTQVFVCNNTKELPSEVPNINPAIGIFTIYQSRNVSLNNCKINGSIRANNNSQMAALLILESNGCTVTDTEVNDTTSTADGSLNSTVAVLYGILIQGSGSQTSEYVIESCHVTKLTSENGLVETNGITVDTCQNITIRATEVNTITAQAAQVRGIFLNTCLNSLIESSQTHEFINSSNFSAGIYVSASDNTVIKGHTASNIFGTINAYGILISNGTSATIDSCQIYKIESESFGRGIFLISIQDLSISTCSINNIGLDSINSFGILLDTCSNGALTSNKIFNIGSTTGSITHGISLLTSDDIVVKKCTVSSISGRDAVGILGWLGERLTFDTCVTTNVTGGFGNTGTGIKFVNATNSTTRDCVSTGNSTNGFEDNSQNTFFGNYAEANTNNYVGVNNSANISTFTKASGLFSVITTPNRWTNIQAE